MSYSENELVQQAKANFAQWIEKKEKLQLMTDIVERNLEQSLKHLDTVQGLRDEADEQLNRIGEQFEEATKYKEEKCREADKHLEEASKYKEEKCRQVDKLLLGAQDHLLRIKKICTRANLDADKSYPVVDKHLSHLKMAYVKKTEGKDADWPALCTVAKEFFIQ